MRNPDMNGTVSIGWTIERGRVTEAHEVSDTSGDPYLAKCILGKVRSFRFRADLDAVVAEFPWSISG
jgi:hypothetical protein